MVINIAYFDIMFIDLIYTGKNDGGCTKIQATKLKREA
jgi:hypothetical protein